MRLFGAVQLRSQTRFHHATLSVEGGRKGELGGDLYLDQANLQTLSGSSIVANNLSITGGGSLDATFHSGVVRVTGTNAAFNLSQGLEAGVWMEIEDESCCLIHESGFTNEGVVRLSGENTLIWTPNWLGPPNHELRTVISGRGVILVDDGATLELTAGWHSPDYWRQWTVIIENDVCIGSGGTLHTAAFVGFGGLG